MKHHHSCQVIDRDGVPNIQADDDILMIARPHLVALGLNPAWLERHRQVWCDFWRLANVMRTESPRSHSARTIIFILRWRRAMDKPADWPLIRDGMSATLARLYNAATGIPYFDTRDRK